MSSQCHSMSSEPTADKCGEFGVPGTRIDAPYALIEKPTKLINAYKTRKL